MRPIFIILFFAGVLMNHSNAQLRNAGRIISYKKNPGGIEGKTASCIFDIHFYNNNIVRVRVSQEKNFRNFSYALANNEIPRFSNVSVSEKGNCIFLSSNILDVKIEKAPSFRVVFMNKKQEVINEDVKGEAFGTSFSGNRLTIYKKIQEGEKFFGLGEALGNLDRRGTGVTLNNTDTYKYGDARLPMYSSVPFYAGIHHNLIYGLFFNNSYKSFFNFGLSTPYFSSAGFEGGEADYFFMYDESVAKIIEHYTLLTGRMSLPPMWSLGYHQSRADYFPQSRVKNIADTFRTKKIPVDCIVLDAEYEYGYEPFRVNKERFPDMPALAKDLAAMNIELTASVHPGVNIDTTYHSYQDGLKQNVFVKYTDGTLFESEIAPLRCYFPDFTNQKGRAWWADKMKWMKYNGIHGYWNDMNEPAVGGSYLPDNLLFDFDGHKATTAEAKNIFGFQMARSSYEAALKNEVSRRPFVLTRSGFAGVQRYAAIWSGDNTSSDEGLLSGILLNNTLGLSGVAFAGYDIGGYIGNASPGLYKRWIEVGVFSPFCRNHREMYGAPNEPWAYDKEAEAISKTFIGFRYRLMPYIYSAFYEATQTGMPVAQSLSIQYTFDDKVYDNLYQYQFLFGNSMLVVPVISAEKNKKMYLPKGEWYNIYTDEKLTGAKELVEEVPIYQLPVFIKASAIVPMQQQVQSMKEKPGDTLYLHIYNGNEKNSFVYYEDSGDGFDYRQNKFCKRTIEFNPGEKKIIISKQEGLFETRYRKLLIVFHGFDDGFKKLYVNKLPADVKEFSSEILNPLENLLDIYKEQVNEKAGKRKSVSILIDNKRDKMQVEW